MGLEDPDGTGMTSFDEMMWVYFLRIAKTYANISSNVTGYLFCSILRIAQIAACSNACRMDKSHNINFTQIAPNADAEISWYSSSLLLHILALLPPSNLPHRPPPTPKLRRVHRPKAAPSTGFPSRPLRTMLLDDFDDIVSYTGDMFLHHHRFRFSFPNHPPRAPRTRRHGNHTARASTRPTS